ncbi:HAMP domain-containing sensor histidine kinase [Priestia endophytica]|uniref:HAMP domain-containing sensor histidine kinase n=1 Tax=Priestia endophytica TaxID=135735 RepID=UPI000DCA35AC|nr:HAMP domain-containing sensor histidine kinase [Priestia endophytica]RAS73884.1 two-component sensor histidine kinase [Priestia endophytica]
MKLSKKYLLIIVASIFFFPISYLGVNFIYYFLLMNMASNNIDIHYEPQKVEAKWKNDIEHLEGKSVKDILSFFNNSKEYDEARIVWISTDGDVYFDSLQTPNSKWSIAYTIEFMEKGSKGNNLLLKEELGNGTKNGYAMLEIPEKYVGSKWKILREKYVYVWYLMLLFLWALFIFVSWFFFYGIQRRLIFIQRHMEKEGKDGIPEKFKVKNKDELGQVELSFNKMVEKLKESRRKEIQEEELRKKFISDVSHDLRTPLTIIRGHTFTLSGENLSPQGKQSVEIINNKISFVGDLIDNLSSFNLLTAQKMPMNRKKVDVLKIIRSSLTAWYPIFEKEGFEVDIGLEKSLIWHIDEVWMKRILDNLFQNIMRHASSGKYVSVRIESDDKHEYLIVEDKGPGLQAKSDHKGSGIGLSIVEIMVKQMGLTQEISSGKNGTTFKIYQKEE